VPCPLETWLNHQRRDDYWKQGSVNENYDDIQCPVFAVGGWLDGYSSAIFRLLSNLNVPRLGLVAPHGHQWSHAERAPGPAIGFLQESLRWWDHWLKDQATGIMDEPMLRVFMQDDIPAQPWYAECPGRWVAEATWPSPRITPRTFYLNRDGLGDTPGGAIERVNASPQTCGMAGGEWCPYGTGGTGPEFPGDQRFDDGASICFDSAPLSDTLEIVGAPVVELDLAVDRPVAFVAVRLNDVKPDGSVARATYAVLNLTHRDSHEFPEAMEPGKRYRIRVQLNETAYAFRPGHRIRISVSTTYWPMIWPSPEVVTLTLYGGAGTLTLPVRPTGNDEPTMSAFAEPEEGPAMALTQFEPAQSSNTVSRNVQTGRVEVSAERGTGHYRIDGHGMVFGGRNSVEVMAITEGDPLSAESEANFASGMSRGDFNIRIEARTRLRATRDTFILTADLDVWEGEERILAKSWNSAIPRDLM
jgi:predicted acyl esterase